MILHIEGATYERAFCTAFNLEWTSAYVDYAQDNDVNGIQIKGSTHDHPSLLVRPRQLDKDGRDKPYVLIKAEKWNKDDRLPDNPFQIIGWMWGYETERPEWFKAIPRTRPKAYYVPQYALRDISTLDVSRSY